METTTVFSRNIEAYNRHKGTQTLIANQGGQGCFAHDQMVITDIGPQPIGVICDFDVVLTYNLETKRKEWKRVTDAFRHTNSKRCLKITLKSGEVIRCTDDHLFLFNGEWVPIKKIIEQYDAARRMESNSGI